MEARYTQAPNLHNFGALGNLPLAQGGGDPSKLDMNNLMMQVSNGRGSLGYRNEENGTFIPVTEGLDIGQGVGQGLYQGNFNDGFFEYGKSPAEIQARLARMFPSINPGFFKSQDEFDSFVNRLV